MAMGTAEAHAHDVDASSTEVIEPIPGKIKATFAGDIYIKSDIEQSVFCNIIHLTCLDKSRIVVVDDVGSTESRFTLSAPEAGKFRVKLVDTTGKQVVSVLDVPGKFSGMANITDTQLALCVERNTIILLRAEKILTAERSVKLPRIYETEKAEITHLSTYEDNLYICSGGEISKVDLMGNTTTVFHSTEFVDYRCIEYELRCRQHFISKVLYTDGNKTSLYAITIDDTCSNCYLAHGTGTEGVMDTITTLAPGEPRYIVMDDEFELLFVLLFVEHKRALRASGGLGSNYGNDKEHNVIYVLRPGTTDGCVLLCEADGLQDVTTMAYCSKTKQLFVGFKENNYVKVYQLSSVP